MRAKTVQLLSKLTQEFYESCASSFSNTRKNSWAGWEQLIELIEQYQLKHTEPIQEYRLLDLACGNLRFETYLKTRLLKADTANFRYPRRLLGIASDICMTLSQNFAWCEEDERLKIVRHTCDIQSTLLHNSSLTQVLPQAQEGFELVVSFGFMHHLASAQLRLRFLQECAQLLRTHGILCISLWSFMSETSFHKKAKHATDSACIRYPELKQELEAHDYFLGWSHNYETLRYCHHFDEAEVHNISAQLRASFQERYPEEQLHQLALWQADGKNSKLNYYLAFQRRPAEPTYR